MKRLILFVFASGLFVALLFISGHSASVQPASAASRTVTLNVENMYCALCPLTVKTALQKVDGVEHVTVSYEETTATVTFDDSKTDTQHLTEATTKAGYPSAVVPDESGS